MTDGFLSRKFWLDLAERAGSTFVQAFLATLAVSTSGLLGPDLLNGGADFVSALGSAVMVATGAGLVAVGKCLGAGRFGEGTAALGGPADTGGYKDAEARVEAPAEPQASEVPAAAPRPAVETVEPLSAPA